STSQNVWFTHSTRCCASTISLHDALPISRLDFALGQLPPRRDPAPARQRLVGDPQIGRPARIGGMIDIAALVPQHRVEADIEPRSEEHTSELQSRENIVCCLLLEEKK